ncbi:MFS transporter [Aspergillus nidulans var. acristatus]
MGPPNQLAFVHGSDKPLRPKLLGIRSGKPFIIFTVAFAVSTDIFMYGLLVPLTPTALENKVGIPEEQIQSWNSILLALYSAAFLLFSPVLGHLADRAESRRWPLFLGLLALGVATTLLCIGTNIGLWIAGRLCQGAAVAVVWTVGLALLVDTVEPDELGQAIGYISMGVNIGVLAGPLLGGVLYQYGGYYAVFGLAFGFIGIDLLLRLVLIEKRHAAQWLVSESTPSTPPDRQKQTEKQTGVSVLETDKRTNPSQTPTHNAHPLRQLATLLSSPRLLICLWAHFVLSLLLTSFDSVLPLFVQDLFTWRQTGQGLIFAALVIPHLLDPLIGLFIDRYPTTTRYLISGAFLCAIPPAVLLRLITTNSTQDKIRLCVFLALLGLCIALATTPVTLEIFLAVKEKEDEVPGRFGRGGAVAFSFGLSNMAFAAGSLVGPFFAGYIRQNASWGTMGWAIGVITGVTSVLALWWSGGRILKKAS